MAAPQRAGHFTIAKYPLELFLRVISLSLETRKIGKVLPKLEIS